jgi:ABC-type xylose transport system substrate-binding protein
MKRLDSLQYYLSKQNKNFIEEQVEKEYDITFGMTDIQKFREKYFDDAKNVLSKFEKVNFYLLNKVTGEDTFIDRDQYLKKIAQSKYTIILPAYDSTCFSIFRLLESLQNDCLPLIHEDCYIKDVNKSYNTDLSELITDKPFSENDRIELLNKFKKVFLTVERKFIT